MKTKTNNNPKAPLKTSHPVLRPRRTSRLQSEPGTPVLRFTPTAWAKLHYFCHHDKTEIGGFGLTRTDDLLRVEEFATVKQQTSAVSIAFEDDAVADFFEAQVDAGRKPSQFARIWCHTHPADSPIPSSTDEATFARVFGGCDWAVMFILGRGGETYCRLRFNVGPGGQVLIPVHVDYTRPFEGSDQDAWRAEYERNISVERLTWGPTPRGKARPRRRVLEEFDTPHSEDDEDWMDALLDGLEDESSDLPDEAAFSDPLDEEDEVYS